MEIVDIILSIVGLIAFIINLFIAVASEKYLVKIYHLGWCILLYLFLMAIQLL